MLLWIRHMRKPLVINKERCKGRLYLKFLVLVYDAFKKSHKNHLTMKDFSEKVCRSFSIPKAEAIDVLRLCEEFGYISFVKFGKIKLNYEVIEDDK
jgi:hypothetical protein